MSASHNPWQDNGIKVFGSDGYKLADETEIRIEEEIFRRIGESAAEPSGPATPPVRTRYREDYEDFLRSIVPDLRLDGLKLGN